MKVLSQVYDGAKNLKALLDESVNIWFPEKRHQKVLLEIDPAVSKYFEKKQYFPLQKIVKKHKDGRIVLQTQVSDQFMEIIPTIHEWLPMIKILAPQELKDFSKKLVSEYRNSL